MVDQREAKERYTWNPFPRLIHVFVRRTISIFSGSSASKIPSQKLPVAKFALWLCHPAVIRITLILDTFEFSTASEPSINWIFVWVDLLGQICLPSHRTRKLQLEGIFLDKKYWLKKDWCAVRQLAQKTTNLCTHNRQKLTLFSVSRKTYDLLMYVNKDNVFKCPQVGMRQLTK